MLLSPAYAAESGASDSTADAAVATAAEAQSVKLVFASDKTLTGANGDTVKEIFKSRLDALGYKDYTLTVADDGSTITVELPASVQVSHLADYLVQPAAFFRVRRGRQGMADERGSQAGHEHQGQQGRHRLRRADADDKGPPEPQGGDRRDRGPRQRQKAVHQNGRTDHCLSDHFEQNRQQQRQYREQFY